jgi:murein DD-endopeptidase MepM/ murein hydrolase activator NlpD
MKIIPITILLFILAIPVSAAEHQHDAECQNFHAEDINDYVDVGGDNISVGGSHDQDLENQINSKANELKEIHRKIQQNQDSLQKTEKKKKTLTREINRNSYKINQLQLSLKSNKINIDKLGLEITSLNGDIDNTKSDVELKNEAIYKIIRELHLKESEDIAISFLKNLSLSESLTQINDLSDLHKALSRDVKELLLLKQALNSQLGQVSKKRSGVEQEYKTSRVRKSLVEEQRSERRSLLAMAKNQAKSYEEEIDELNKRQEDIAKEVEKLEATLRRQINPDGLPPERPGVLSWPVERGYKRITQGYGSTRFARYGYRGRWHNGIDIGFPGGTPILASADGIVTNIGDQDKYCRRGAYGKYIVIRHSNNLVTLSAHLSRIAVSPGTRIKRGDLIGYLGSTGYSTGPHLHFTVYDSSTFKMRRSRSCGPMPSGGDLDPRKYL